MEYLAFGLLGLGAILILIGIISSRDKKSREIPFQASEIPSHHEKKSPGIQSQYPINEIQSPMELNRTPSNAIQNQISPLQSIQITKSEKNALLFSCPATLYSDKSGLNLYDGSKTDPGMFDTALIHRIGVGEIAFDGFTIFFHHKNSKDTFKVIDLDRISFYPNCIAIRKKQSSTAFLFFIDNTLPIKAVLEKHLMIHVT